MSPALEAEAVSVRAGASMLLDRVTFTVMPGETVAIVGPNGAGKSTLLRVLSGEIAPSAGAVRLKGREPRSCRPAALASKRAVLSQHVAVAFPFSVADVVRMGAGDRRGSALDALVDAALVEVDLDSMRDRIIGTLSGGEQQRAHLARVLVQLACGEADHGPGVLMLDEPTSNLDLCHQLDLLAIVGRRNERGTTVLAVVHDLNLATLVGRRILALDHGRLAGDGPAGAIVTDDMLGRVFGVGDAVNRVPPGPFVLPQLAKRLDRG